MPKRSTPQSKVACGVTGYARFGTIFMISIDLETDLIDRGKLAPDPVCVSWFDGDLGGVSHIADARELARGWIAGGETLIGTNVAYDMAVLGGWDPSLLGPIWDKYERNQIQDVSICQRLLDIAVEGKNRKDGYSLESLCSRYGLVSPDKESPWRLEYASLRGVPVHLWPDSARDYCLDDARRPWEIRVAQDQAEPWPREGLVLALAGFEARKAFALHLMSCWGFHTSRDRAMAFVTSVRAHLGRTRGRLVRSGLLRATGSLNTKAARTYLEKIKPGVARTPKGLPKLDAESCEASGSRLLALYSAFSVSSKLLSRAEDLLLGVDLPLQPAFVPLLETGRTSSRKPSPPLVGIQAQNFPRAIGARETLEPRPGCVFVVADYAGAELHSLAQICLDLFGRSTMAEQLNAGKDLHTWFAARVLDVDYDTAATDPEARQNAKACNFGFPGGMGLTRFIESAWKSWRVRLTERRAKELKDMWLLAFPEMQLLFRWVSRHFSGGNDRATVRHPRSGRWRGGCSYCELANGQFQELTATAAGEALAEVSRNCYVGPHPGLFGTRPILYTHDEIVIESHERRGHDGAMALSGTMETVFNRWHPDCPISASPLITRIYSKKAKPVWANGRLVPWEPDTQFA